MGAGVGEFGVGVGGVVVWGWDQKSWGRGESTHFPHP